MGARLRNRPGGEAIRGRRGLLWLAMAGLWASRVAALPLQINLASNPSFEHGLPLQQQVYDWTPAPEFPDAEYTWDAEEKHTGERSLRLHASLKPDGTWANAGWVSPGFPASPAFVTLSPPGSKPPRPPGTPTLSWPGSTGSISGWATATTASSCTA